jgi:L-lactate dehydrogenase complex protein LldG
MFDEFKSRAEAGRAEVYRFSSKEKALTFIIDVLKEEGVSDSLWPCAVWANCSFLKGIDQASLVEKVPGLTFDVTRETVTEAKVGISQMEWALAATGTLVQKSASVEQRLVSSLSQIHIALIATDRILSDREALLMKMSPDEIRFEWLYDFDRLIIIFVDELGSTS